VEFPLKFIRPAGQLLDAVRHLRALAFLDFPTIEARTIDLDELPWPPQAEVVQMVGWLQRRPFKARRGAQRVQERAGRKLRAAGRLRQGCALPG